MARPGARRQLSGAGPLLLWRDRQDNAREGLLLSVTVCETRFCTMRHVLVEGVRVEEELHFAWVEGGEIVALGPLDTDVGPRPAFLVSVDVDRGNITPRGDDGPQDRDAIAWLRAELDDELIGVLRERFFRARGGIETTAAAVRRAPRAGRNDPCPCGSGKKFKRCCL